MTSNQSNQGRPGENEPPPGSAISNAEYYLNLQAPTPQQRSGNSQPFNIPPQRRNSQGTSSGQPESSLRMGRMAGALPAYQQAGSNFVPVHNLQRQPSSSAHTNQPQGSSQFAGQTMISNPGYNAPFSSQYPTSFTTSQQAMGDQLQYLQQQSNQHVQTGGPSPLQAPYPSSSYFPNQQQQQYVYYPTAYGQVSPQQQFQSRPNAYSPYYRRASQPYIPGLQQQQQLDMVGGLSGPFSPPQGAFTPGTAVVYGQGMAGPFLRPENVPTVSRQSSGSSPGSIPSAPRGPPRKPKQSGHALWVGNLPPGTLITDLKDHFSRDATNDIESVFLISKSNCAFVNYRTEDACSAAMSRFHDSRFQGIRLVCRLRRTASAPAPGVPTGPAALATVAVQVQSATEAIAQNREVSSQAEEAARQAGENVKVNEKFFIVKSLTVEDLELSARNGIWATQAHNEDALNKAFESTENVYLIFSANKSGEYFGYARMVSPINEDASANLEWTPRAEVISDDPDLPRSIPTTATEFAPKGRIIDDSARGTIFWEADPTAQDASAILMDDEDTKSEGSADEAEAKASENLPGAHAFGKPFKIEWLSTERLPFYRTRGLRNPWNANREVKIARDGTELETNVGRRLVQMFHRSTPVQMLPHTQTGYHPPMRPY